MPDAPSHRLLYHIDTAANCRFGVIVESPLDAWRIGRPAVALLGPTMSPEQMAIMWQRFHGKPIFIVFDPRRASEAASILSQLAQFRGFSHLINVELPYGCGPEFTDRCIVWKAICAAAERHGIGLDFFVEAGLPPQFVGLASFAAGMS
jgi:hypothetical protein